MIAFHEVGRVTAATHIMRFGENSTYELGITPDDYDAQLDVDFSALGKRVAVAA
ncbi:hypothetical protein ACWCQ1_47365 [Streptomyces sp. NPDC002144]|uniref:hypothetical protein n=1 Tax=unclassified Streptomyces TaxID=2593676 RepID=UPI00332B116B